MLAQFLVLIVYAAPLFFVIQPWGQFILFVLGLIIGALLLIVDEKVIMKYYSNLDDDKPDFPISRSVVFLLTYFVMSIYLAKSSSTRVGHGVMMGIGLSLLQEMWFYKRRPQLFMQRFLGQIKMEKLMETDLPKLINRILIGFLGLLILLTVLMI